MKNLFIQAIVALSAVALIHADPPPPATEANVHYGPDAAQVLDFWKAPSDKPTPVVFCIHGGGWMGGNKTYLDDTYGVKKFTDAGISVVSIEYRFIKQTILKDKNTPLPVITPEKVAHEKPPVDAPLSDAARALQFVRSKAAEWNLDKARIGLCGGSAGGCSSLWLACHKDMADAASADPVARESTRPWCAAVTAPQSTLDPQIMKDWTPNSNYGGHAFGFAWDPTDKLSEFNHFLAGRSIILPWIKEYSPEALMTSDAVPIYILCEGDAPERGKEKKDPTHTANFGAILQEKAKSVGAELEFNYKGATGIAHANVGDYLLWKLKEPKQFMKN